MNSNSDFFPHLTDSFLHGQDMLYQQFNDINFYIEDFDQENLYFYILKKHFTNIQLSKIFPLNGKKNVINECKNFIDHKKKIYIVDKDFDDILNKTENINNLFYLDKYSIENYLLEKDAIIDLIIEELPKLKRNDINISLEYSYFLSECLIVYSYLIPIFLIVQSNDMGITNVDYGPEYFCYFQPFHRFKNNNFNSYYNLIKSKVNNDGKCFGLEYFKFYSYGATLKNIPGKFLIKSLAYKLKKDFKIQMKWESLIIRLAKLCELNSLNQVINKIETYIEI